MNENRIRCDAVPADREDESSDDGRERKDGLPIATASPQKKRYGDATYADERRHNKERGAPRSLVGFRGCV